LETRGQEAALVAHSFAFLANEWGHGGKSLGQTITHEGSHIEDDISFLKSYDASTGKYNPGLNFTHFDTEFQAFEAGSGVKSYSMFPKGPKGYQQLEDYIYRAYPSAEDLLFPPSVYPQ
jgi:hypothetical protein